jgi:hypothetical protein
MFQLSFSFGKETTDSLGGPIKLQNFPFTSQLNGIL